MPNSVKMVAVLTIAGFLSGGFLTAVYMKAAPEIEKKSLESLRKAIFLVLPEAVDYKEIKLTDQILYRGIDKDGREAGFSFLAEGNGFQGEIKVMVGVDQGLNKIQYIHVLESVETPGLGARIAEDNFQQQFKGASIREEIRLAKGPKPEDKGPPAPVAVQAITGATISSEAIVDIINRKIAAIKKIIKERGGDGRRL